MTDTARLLLTAALLSATSLGAFAWRVSRLDPAAPERLIAELRLSQFAAITLAAIAATPMGMAVVATGPLAPLDVALGVAFATVAGYILLRAPQDALWLAAGTFVAHALVMVAHRPGWLDPDLAPRWYLLGCAIYDVYIAGLCYWASRR